MKFCKELIDSKIVHKTIENDVLIFKPGIVIKCAITKNEYDSFVNTSHEVKTIIDSVYYETDGYYVLRTLPHVIDKEKTSSIFTQLNIDNFYTDDNNGNLKIVPTYIPLHVEETIRAKLKPYISPISANEKRIISSISADAPVNSYLLKNDTSDYYFYKKITSISQG